MALLINPTLKELAILATENATKVYDLRCDVDLLMKDKTLAILEERVKIIAYVVYVTLAGVIGQTVLLLFNNKR